MAINSLTDHNITSLSQIFDTSLQYYCKHVSPLESEYVKKLSTIMGLGFTTVLVDGDLLVTYESRTCSVRETSLKDKAMINLSYSR